MDKKEMDLRAQVLKRLYSIPFYHDLSRQKKNELYDAMMKAYAEEAFCKEHGIVKTENFSIIYCGQEIEFADRRDADNFISDMYELSLCCAGKF